MFLQLVLRYSQWLLQLGRCLPLMMPCSRTLTSPCLLMVELLFPGLGLLMLLILLLLEMMMKPMKSMMKMMMRVTMRVLHLLGKSSIDGNASIPTLFFAFLVFRCQRGRRE